MTLALLIADTIHSFRQHKQWPTDGDMLFNVIPSEDMDKVLTDPLAMKVLMHDEHYLNPNRYFSHLAVQEYCWNVPLLLQRFTTPIDSVYLSQAILKTVNQLALIFLLAAFVVPFRKIWSIEFLLCALLVTPFFQTFGYNGQMGIIDRSTTYDFFYSFPIVFVMLFFLPVIRAMSHKEFRLTPLTQIFMLACAFIASFSGPLNLGVAPVACLAVIFFLLKAKGNQEISLVKRFVQIPKSVLIPLMFFLLCCAYSLFINAKAGTMAEDVPPLLTRYALCLEGLWQTLTIKIGLGWLLGLIVLNLTLIQYKLKSDEATSILRLSKWIGICILIYLFLLPLGGYRSYRGLIVRNDTFMPVTLALFWIYVQSAFFIISTYKTKFRFSYYFVIIYSSVLFTQYDKLADAGHECEKKMMQEIAASKETIVKLSEPCPLLDWHIYTDYKDSEKASQLLLHWNVIKEKKLFYHPAE
ncbi:MAG: hypothetical protein ACKVOR_11835 [Flavobacteriales bacterium]